MIHIVSITLQRQANLSTSYISLSLLKDSQDKVITLFFLLLALNLNRRLNFNSFTEKAQSKRTVKRFSLPDEIVANCQRRLVFA